MNKAELCGRLTADPEITRTSNATIAKYTLAVDRKYKQEGQPTADFIRCVCFGKSAEFVEKYLHKGTKIIVIGRIQTGSYKNKDGQTVYTTDVVVEEHEFCESRTASNNNAGDDMPKQASNEFVNIPDGIDEDLPFAQR